jgi:hypothetical protein
LVGCFASGDKKKNNKPEVDQYPLPVQYIHLSFIIPPHWKIDTVVIRRSRSNVIISSIQSLLSRIRHPQRKLLFKPAYRSIQESLFFGIRSSLHIHLSYLQSIFVIICLIGVDPTAS